MPTPYSYVHVYADIWLQDTTVAELEHFASDEELTAMCILLARRLPDKQAATHFLQRWVSGRIMRWILAGGLARRGVPSETFCPALVHPAYSTYST